MALKTNTKTKMKWLLALSVFIPNSPSRAQDNYPVCVFHPGQSGIVKQVTKQNNIDLTNGHRLTLANIKLAHGINRQWLNKSLQGQKITYFFSGQKTDRHNRYISQIFINHNGQQKWLQADLILRGLATVYATDHNKRCFQLLEKKEQQARKQKQGEWQTGKRLRIYDEKNVQRLNQHPQGNFVIVKGQVQSIGRSSNNTFINFDKNWRTDFTIVIASKLLSRKTLTWPYLKGLVGKKVIARGWLDHWNGPMIRIEIPQMLQVID